MMQGAKIAKRVVDSRLRGNDEEEARKMQERKAEARSSQSFSRVYVLL